MVKLGWIVVALTLSGAQGAPRPEPCEPSAAVEMQDGRILVADNETKDRLFAYLWDAHGTHPAASFEITWDASAGRKVEDIEALANDGSRLYLVGSHSRKKNCERDDGRFRILRARVDGNELVGTVVMTLASAGNDAAWREATSSATACLEHLFTPDARRSPAARRFCDALVDAERRANWGGTAGAGLGAGVAAHCQQTLNIEGAAVLDGRLWIGLRAPVVGSERHAALLRVREDGAIYRFDAVAFVALEGRGIRELQVSSRGQSQLWGIAGPVEDGPASNGRGDAASATTGFDLWSVDAARLQPEALLEPTLNRSGAPLPPASEGLVLRPPQVLVWIDGDGKYPADCKEPHRTALIPLR